MIMPEKPVIWVHPQKITLYVAPPGAAFALWMRARNPLDRVTSAPAYALWRKRLVFGGNWDLATAEVRTLRQSRWTADLARHEADYRASKWYRKARAALERDGVYRHKTLTARSLGALEALFETDFLPLLDSMRRAGYQPRGDDWPLGVIDRQGRVLKSEKGRHRFAAALATGVTRFPLQIAAIHRHWAGGSRGAALTARVMALAGELQ